MQKLGYEINRCQKNNDCDRNKYSRNHLMVVEPISATYTDCKNDDEPQHKPRHDCPANLSLEFVLRADELGLCHDVRTMLNR